MIIIINAPYGGSVWTHLTLGDVDSGLEGAESAKRDETPWSVYHGPLATARYTWLNRDECSRLGQMHVRFENEKNKTVNLRRRRKRTLRHDTISYHSIVLYILSMCFHRVLVSIDMSVRLRVGLVRYSTAQHSTVQYIIHRLRYLALTRRGKRWSYSKYNVLFIIYLRYVAKRKWIHEKCSNTIYATKK